MTTPALSLPPTCKVYVDHALLQSGLTGEDPDAPTVLTNLSIDWGRSNALDQVPPATCTLSILDRKGGQTYLDVLHQGARLDIDASATLYPDPTVPVMFDPGFETDSLNLALPASRGVVTGATSKVVNTTVHSGGQALQLTTRNPDQTAYLTMGPAEFSSVPTAWDAVPRTLAGQTWKFGVWIRVPQSALSNIGLPVLSVQPVSFSSPRATTAVPVGSAVVASPPFSSWFHLEGTVEPPPGLWLGLRVGIQQNGPVWATVLPTVTWGTMPDPTVRWADLGVAYLDDLELFAPDTGVERVGRVFSGRITDLDAYWDASVDAAVVKVLAQDDLAELNNRYIGDVPWVHETMASRAARILSTAAQPGLVLETVPSSIGSKDIAWRDVDAQPAGALLSQLARSVGGVLWTAASVGAGPFLKYEDQAARSPMFELVMGVDGIVRIEVLDAPLTGGLVLDACDILLDPVHWVQTAEDDSTRILVNWWTNGSAAVGTAKVLTTETLIDTARETATGRRSITVPTDLTNATDARLLATTILARTTVPGWRVSGIVWRLELVQHLDADQIERVMKVLDGVTRLGLPILLDNLPGWVPITAEAQVALYLEGGRFSNVNGIWSLELLTSSAEGQGRSLRWSDLTLPPGNAFQWQDMDPAIQWQDLAGTTV
jgi:hypothetical protein